MPHSLASARRRPDAHASITVATLDDSHRAAIDALRERALADLPHDDCYVPHDQEPAFVSAHLGPAGLSFGLYVDGTLAGYSALTLDAARACLDPAFERRIAACCAAQTRPSEACCALAVTMVLREFRGRGLHKAALDHRLRLARALGRTLVFAMVSPHNGASLHNLSAFGLSVHDTLTFPGGRRRVFLTGTVLPGGPSCRPQP